MWRFLLVLILPMHLEILQKVALFWIIFNITPGPVWVSVMEATHKLDWRGVMQFFYQVFLRANVLIQFSLAILSSLALEFVSRIFIHINLLLYIFGGIYITYLAFKILKSKKSNQITLITFTDLAVILLLSPKIWLLFPTGAATANQLSDGILFNALMYGVLMLCFSTIGYFLYTFIGKMGAKVLKDNFNYLSFSLLILFAIFLFNEARLITIT